MSDSRGDDVQWSGAGYAQTSGHHRAYDDWFLARRPPGSTDTVVDLGCGTGEFTARLASLVPDGRVIGVDPDASMLEAAARHRLPNIELRQASAERLEEVVEPSVADLVVSRAMLHWLPLERYRRCFEAVLAVLRPGGWYHSESAGAGNVAKVTTLMDDIGSRHGLSPLVSFPDPGLVLELVEAAGFEVQAEGVRTIGQRRPFTRAELVGFLRHQASVALTRQATVEQAAQIVDEAVSRADELRRHDGTFDQTFVRLEILARRPA